MPDVENVTASPRVLEHPLELNTRAIWMRQVVDIEIRGKPGDAGLVRQRSVRIQVGPGEHVVGVRPLTHAPDRTSSESGTAWATAGNVFAGTSLTLADPWMSTNWIRRKEMPSSCIRCARLLKLSSSWAMPVWSFLGRPETAGVQDPRLLATAAAGASRIGMSPSFFLRSRWRMCGIVGFRDKTGRLSCSSGRITLAMHGGPGLPRTRRCGRRGDWPGTPAPAGRRLVDPIRTSPTNRRSIGLLRSAGSYRCRSAFAASEPSHHFAPASFPTQASLPATSKPRWEPAAAGLKS